MIYEVEGDIMLSRAPVLVQGVGVNDPMTRGLARKLQEKYPAMREAFHDWCAENNPEPGEIWMWRQPGKAIIINLLTHRGDSDPTRIRRPEPIALNRCFRALNRLAGEERFKAMAMPPVGAGEFGLDWSEVKAMLHAQLSEFLYPIFIYTKQLEGQVAHEPGM